MKRKFTITLLVSAVATFLVASNSDARAWVSSNSGVCFIAEDGDKQSDLEYFPTEGWVYNENTTTDTYTVCNSPSVDNEGGDGQVQVRLRVQDGDDQDDVDCWFYRREIRDGGVTAEIDQDHDDTAHDSQGTSFTGADTLYFDLYDANNLSYQDYYYWVRCELPDDDVGTSRVYAFETNGSSSPPAGW